MCAMAEYLFVDNVPKKPKGCSPSPSPPHGLTIALRLSASMKLPILTVSPHEKPEMRDLPYQESGSTRLPIDCPRFSALPESKTRRSAAFGSSVLVHAAAICSLLFWSVPVKQ